jgi:ubiquinone/menaquinone biosynthesis C-methylase UbiE
MLDVAAKRNRKHIEISLSLGSAEQTGLAGESIDRAYTVNTVYFWSSLDAGLTEIWRILRPDGVFINTVYSKTMLDSLPVTKSGYAKYDIDELLDAGERNGFSAKAKPIADGRSYSIIYKKA